MRIIVADDHPLYLDAACQQLARTFRKADVVTTTSVTGVLDLLAAASADLVMLDYSMPGADGIEGLKRVIAAAMGTPVVVMSGVAAHRDIQACIAAGAKGFLPKTLESRLFVAAVSLVINGGTYVPAELMTAPAQEPADAEPTGPLNAADFNANELALLRMVVAGASNKEIARNLSLQEVTIKFYLTRLFRKMGVKNRSLAAVAAVRSGLVTDD